MDKVVLIAELSSNHMGDMSLARDMVIAAKVNGADIVKFQTWKTSKLKSGPWDHDGRRSIYENAELTKDKHYGAMSLCKEVGIEFLTSVFDAEDLGFVRELTNKVKIASTECNNTSLVTQAIDMFDEVFISTGAMQESEYRKWADKENVYLLHCVSKYPCPAENVNLAKLEHLKAITPRFGYSGHYVGIWDAVAAATIGAKVIEKHFTTDRGLPFKDNKFAILPEELKQLRTFVDELSLMKINHGNDFQPCEEGAREVYSRRWCGENS